VGIYFRIEKRLDAMIEIILKKYVNSKNVYSHNNLEIRPTNSNNFFGIITFYSFICAGISFIFKDEIVILMYIELLYFSNN